jgi:hypothetical protein
MKATENCTKAGITLKTGERSILIILVYDFLAIYSIVDPGED